MTGSPAGQRGAPEQRGERAHRARAFQIRSLDAQIARRQDERAALTADGDQALRELAARFGRAVPADPTGMLYDVLERVVVEADGGWRWLGATNNKGLPTVRRPAASGAGAGDSNREISVRRLLAVAFDVIGPDDECLLYPDARSQRCGYPDVNPFRCTIRRFADGLRRGNPARFAGSPGARATTA